MPVAAAPGPLAEHPLVGEATADLRPIGFGFEADGEPKATTRTTATFTFDEALSTGEGDMFIELLDPTQDPLDESAEPFSTLLGTFSARRVVVPVD